MHSESIKMKNLKSRRLYMRVYDELRDYIYQKKLQPGDMLPTEMEMCEMLGVSRNVVREAIKALEITGIVRSKPGVGIIIQEFNPDFMFQTIFYNLTIDSETLLDQTLAVRRILELGFMDEAFETIQPSDLHKLSALVEEMRRIYRQKCAGNEKEILFGPEFYRADAKFHMELFSNVDNKIMRSIIEATWQCDRFHQQVIHVDYMEDAVKKHAQITEALKARDLDDFRRAMYYHFDVEYKHKN